MNGWQRALVLAPHTDDGEFGCGATMARLVEVVHAVGRVVESHRGCIVVLRHQYGDSAAAW